MYTEQLSQGISIPANPTHAAAQTTSFNSNGIDLQKFGRCLFLIDVGAVSGTSPTLDAKLQESVDNSTFTDLSGTGVSITQITSANKTVTIEVRADQLSAGKRYARLACTIAGTSPSFTMAIIPLAGEATFKPANANDAAQVTQRQVVS